MTMVVGFGPAAATSRAVTPSVTTRVTGEDWDHDWTARANCREGNPDELFVQGAEQHKAKVLCLACPVRTECLADALDNRTEFGVWGGLTERERRALLRRRPEVASWQALLASARRDHAAGRLGMAG